MDLQIFDAITKNNTTKLEDLLTNHCVNINSLGLHNGRTSLMVAIEWDNMEALELLVEKGANLNYLNEDGDTALTYACQFNRHNMVKFLTEKGANTCKGNEEKSPLLEAIMQGNLTIAEYLLENGGEFSLHHSLIYAAESAKLDFVKLLLKSKPDVNMIAKNGSTLLLKVISQLKICEKDKEYFEITELLIESGAEVNVKGPDGDTPLLKAIKLRNNGLVKLLIENHSDVNAKGNDGCTPLLKAIDESRDENLEQWLQETLLEAFGYLSIVKLLIENHADVNVKGPDGNTALLKAIESSDGALVELLIKNHADVNAEGPYGNIPLLVAIESRDLPFTELLLVNHADVNVRTIDGSTPLLRAITFNDEDIIRSLVKNRADVNLKADDGSSPLFQLLKLKKKNYFEIAKLLIENNADVNFIEPDGSTTLLAAIELNNFDLVKYLIEKGAKVNRFYNGTCPIMKCVEKENCVMLKLLIDSGAKFDIADDLEEKLLNIAADNQDFLSIKYFIEAGIDFRKSGERLERLCEDYPSFAMYFKKLKRGLGDSSATGARGENAGHEGAPVLKIR